MSAGLLPAAPSPGEIVSVRQRQAELLRRAPDPFVQLIPEGLHQGGTVLATGTFPPSREALAAMAAALPAPEVDNAKAVWERIQGPPLEPLFATMAEIHRDRATSYAPFLEALGLPPMGLPAHLP
jgi:hypothetical protein